MLKQLYKNVDVFFEKCVNHYQEHMACQKGCSSCCMPHLSISLLEVPMIEEYLKEYPLKKERLENQCPMLDPKNKGCRIYEVRPMVCRTHGLALKYEDEVSFCEKNFQQTDIEGEYVLDMDKVHKIMFSLMMQKGISCEERVSLEDLYLQYASDSK